MRKVYIIILNWNGLKDTLECLKSIDKLDYRPFEVIVVDNGSIDNSSEIIVKNFPNVFLMKNSENLGYAKGNNLAMRYAMEHGADYLWLLNNDTVVEKDTLSNLIDNAEKFADIGMVSPVIHFYYEPKKVQFCGSYVDTRKMEIIYPKENHASASEDFVKGKYICLWGTALLAKREVIKKIGYLNEDYFAYWEDTDYSLRSIKSGFRNEVIKSARIFHKTLLPKPGVKRRGNHFYYYMARNKYYWGKHHSTGIIRYWFQRNYFAEALRLYNLAFTRQISCDEAEAYLTGVNDAIHGKSGKWDGIINVPAWLEKLCSMMCSWHPFFWIDLLNGEIGKIGQQIYNRSKLKVSNMINVLKS